ncbi:MAG: hypothetical protein ACOH2V_10525 [Candidatus Saccharimonadaceae bacterium]
MIERQNILGLLGKDSNKYHSCIITSYSFDFLFFEQRVLPALRNAGIINVNLFIDANMLNRQLEMSDGRHLQAKKSYSITPIYMCGAFHPKILLAIGKKKGMAAIGSGNFTSSGMSTNEEIWAAFSTSETDGYTNPVFKHLAEYILQLQSFSFATNIEKFKWITENSDWYNALLKMPAMVPEIINDGKSFRVLSTNADHSLYKDLLDTLPDNPESIKILSPYYNEKGTFIRNICQDLHPKSVHCIVDPTFGTLPFQIDPQLSVEFSDWSQLDKEEKYKHARLHAKAIQFEYPDKTYFLFGSSNATIEAMGSIASNSHNAELIILISSATIVDYFGELGVKFPTSGNYSLDQYLPKQKETVDTENKDQITVSLLHAEWDLNELLVFTEYQGEDQIIELIVFDADENRLFESVSITLYRQLIFRLPAELGDQLFKVALFSNQRRISNYAFIHQVGILNRTNPDTRLARFNELLNSEQFSDLDFSELLEYAQFMKNKSSSSTRNSNSYNVVKDVQGVEENIIQLSEEAFNRSAGEADLYNYSARRQMALLEEFLNTLSFSASISSEDVSDSTEIDAFNAGDNGLPDEKGTVGRKRIELSFEQGRKLKLRLHCTLNRITDSLSWHKVEVSKTFFAKNDYPHKASLDQIQALLIGCHIFLFKRDNYFNEQRCLLRLEFDNFKNKETLLNVEKELDLHRLYDQNGNTKNQVSYTIDEKNASHIASTLKNNIGISLLYMDGTPSQIIYHQFFDHSVWPENNKQSAAERFILDGVGAFLLLMFNGCENYLGKELIRWELYKERLFYRLLLIVLTYRWKQGDEVTRKLMLLNAFHKLCPQNLSEFKLKENLNQLAKALNLSSVFVKDALDFIVNTYEIYLQWALRYSQDVNSTKEDLNQWKPGRIIFNKRLGFACLDHYYTNHFVNIETPLGFKENGLMFTGFKEVFIGLKTVFYSDI